MLNFDRKFNLRQNTVSSVTNFTRKPENFTPSPPPSHGVYGDIFQVCMKSISAPLMYLDYCNIPLVLPPLSVLYVLLHLDYCNVTPPPPPAPANVAEDVIT